MPTLAEFATDRYPLHCSRLPQFLACPWKIVMEHLGIYHRDGGVGAQTGTVVHKGVQTWHTNGKDEDSAIGVMDGMRGEQPLADYTEAELLFRKYTADPRNREAKIAVHAGTSLVEVLFHGQITHPRAASGQGAREIVLEGTCDQIREEEDGTWKVWDLKTSKQPGEKIRDQHTYQLAAYAYLATRRFKRLVLPGGVIMARGYGRVEKVWFPYTLTAGDVDRLMSAVVDRVRDVREGRLHAVPGEYCDFCLGVQRCLPRLRQTMEYSNGEQ